MAKSQINLHPQPMVRGHFCLFCSPIICACALWKNRQKMKFWRKRVKKSTCEKKNSNRVLILSVTGYFFFKILLACFNRITFFTFSEYKWKLFLLHVFIFFYNLCLYTDFCGPDCVLENEYARNECDRRQSYVTVRLRSANAHYFQDSWWLGGKPWPHAKFAVLVNCLFFLIFLFLMCVHVNRT